MANEGLSIQTEAARALRIFLSHPAGLRRWAMNDQASFLIRIEKIAYDIIADFTKNSREAWMEAFTLLWNLPDSLSQPLSSNSARVSQIFNEATIACSREQPEIIRRFGVELLSIVSKVGSEAFEAGTNLSHV
jgi:hypothetical protein